MGTLMWWQTLELGYEGSGFVSPESARGTSDILKENFSKAFDPACLTEWLSSSPTAEWMDSTQALDFAKLMTKWLLDGRKPICPPLRARAIYQNYECFMDSMSSECEGKGKAMRPDRSEDRRKPPGIKCRMVGGGWKDYIGFYLEARFEGHWEFWDGTLLDSDLKLTEDEQVAIIEGCGDETFLPELEDKSDRYGEGKRSMELINVFVTATLAHSCPA